MPHTLGSTTWDCIEVFCCYNPVFLHLISDLLQRWPQLVEGYWLLCLGHSWDYSLQAIYETAERRKCNLISFSFSLLLLHNHLICCLLLLCDGLFQNLYRAKGIEHFKQYSVVMDTPVYETCKQSAKNLSEVTSQKHVSECLYCILIEAESSNSYTSCLQLNYRHDYVTNVMGKNTAPAVTVDSERARQANYIQSDVWLLSLTNS